MEDYFNTGDIVRFNAEQKDEYGFGLFEVTGYDADGLITLTKNECNSEFYSKQEFLILVCKVGRRVDI